MGAMDAVAGPRHSGSGRTLPPDKAVRPAAAARPFNVHGHDGRQGGGAAIKGVAVRRRDRGPLFLLLSDGLSLVAATSSAFFFFLLEWLYPSPVCFTSLPRYLGVLRSTLWRATCRDDVPRTVPM